MNEFEQQVISQLSEQGQRLARMEGKLENGMSHSLAKVEEWVDAWMQVHPKVCPVEERKALIWLPLFTAVASAALTAIVMKALGMTA
jgi:hypothetical protein